MSEFKKGIILGEFARVGVPSSAVRIEFEPSHLRERNPWLEVYIQESGSEFVAEMALFYRELVGEVLDAVSDGEGLGALLARHDEYLLEGRESDEDQRWWDHRRG